MGSTPTETGDTLFLELATNRYPSNGVPWFGTKSVTHLQSRLLLGVYVNGA